MSKSSIAGKVLAEAAEGVIPDVLTSADFAIMKSGEKKSRSRTGAPNKSSDEAIRKFIIGLSRRCPRFMGGSEELFSSSEIAAKTLLARVISALDYKPSSLEILSSPIGLSRKGIIESYDIPRMTLRMMTEHCSRKMLDEIENAAIEHEIKLIAAAGKASAVVPAPVTETDLDAILAPLATSEDAHVRGAEPESSRATKSTEDWGSW